MLLKLGTKLINQANSNDALYQLGETKDVSSLRNTINQVFDELGSSNESSSKRLVEVVDKAKSLLQLIKDNISLAKGSKNFDLVQMKDDQMNVQDIIFRIEIIRTVHVDQLKDMNAFSYKHKQLNKLIKE